MSGTLRRIAVTRGQCGVHHAGDVSLRQPSQHDSQRIRANRGAYAAWWRPVTLMSRALEFCYNCRLCMDIDHAVSPLALRWAHPVDALVQPRARCLRCLGCLLRHAACNRHPPRWRAAHLVLGCVSKLPVAPAWHAGVSSGSQQTDRQIPSWLPKACCDQDSCENACCCCCSGQRASRLPALAR